MHPFLRFAGAAGCALGAALPGAERAFQGLPTHSASPRRDRRSGESQRGARRRRFGNQDGGRDRDRLSGEVASVDARPGEAGESASGQGGLRLRERSRFAPLMAAAAGSQTGSSRGARPRARLTAACQGTGGAGGAGGGGATGVIRAAAGGRARRPPDAGVDELRQNQGSGEEPQAGGAEAPSPERRHVHGRRRCIPHSVCHPPRPPLHDGGHAACGEVPGVAQRLAAGSWIDFR